MLKIAITGNIASGKSVLEKHLKSQGYKVFDTDEIAHSILENCTDIINLFKGYDIISDGKTDRKKIGNIVFNNNTMLKKLEDIVHPLVKSELEKIFNMNYDLVFVSVPLLFETGFDKLFDRIIFVSADINTRTARLMKRNNFTKEEALKRIATQQKEEFKLSKCDFVLYNNTTIEEFKNLIDLNLKKIVEDAH